MTNKEIDILVLKKWYWIWKYYDNKFFYPKNMDKMVQDIPKLKYFIGRNYCIWCFNYCQTVRLGQLICEKCPLAFINDVCDQHSTYDNWGSESTSENAKKMLDTCIKAIKKVRKYKSFDFINEILKGNWLK